MKTSTKILIAYIFLALTTTLVMFILSKKLVHNLDQDDCMTRKNPLPNFTVVVAMGNTEFNLEGAVINSVAWRVPKKNPKMELPAKMFVRNDTLFVQKTDSSLSFDDRVVICCKSLKSIVAMHHVQVELRKLNSTNLQIQNAKSKVVVNDWYDKKEKHLQKQVDLTVVATDSSETTLYNMKIGSLSASLSHHSKCETREHVGIGHADVELSDHSTALFEKAPLELQMVRDSTSRSTMW